MIHKSAESLADIFCNRGWIKEELQPWCIYALEKWLMVLLFFSIVLLWTLLSGLYVETTAFLIPFYLLRRRMGGYHAKRAYTCFFISISVVIIVSLFIGTWLLPFPIWIIIIADSTVVGTAIILRPAYPLQAHFTTSEEEANIQKKNDLLVLLYAFQLCSAFFGKRILAYSFCGIASCVTTVIIQKQKGNHLK